MCLYIDSSYNFKPRLDLEQLTPEDICESVFVELTLKSKKTAFQIWKSYPEGTEVFQSLSSPQVTIIDEQFKVLQRFVILMYSRTSAHENVNIEQKTMFAMFAQGTRRIENIPTTEAALEQHHEGRISSWPCLGSHTRPYPRASKSRRVGVASCTRGVDPNVDHPTGCIKSMQ